MPDLSKAFLMELAEAKLDDAKFLLAGGRSGNAYYLAGYAVELLLKAVLALRFRADTIPAPELGRGIFTHDLNKLLNLAELRSRLAGKQDDDPEFRARWEIVLRWDEGSRYDPRSRGPAEELIEAIENPEHGVLQWSKTIT
jgi:HEPN domain-containing protein